MPTATPRTYRCPVCGHSDAVEVAVGAGEPFPVQCRYCETALEVRLRAEGDLRLRAVVAEPPDPTSVTRQLDAIPGAYRRASRGREQAEAGEGIPLEEL